MAAEEWDVFSLAPGGSTDPPTFLATLYDARQKQIRVELDGPGSGSFAISRYSTQATTTILAQGNLVKVRFPEIDDDYVFAFSIETGDFTLASSSEEGGEMLQFGGRGALAYLAKAVMWNQRYITRVDQPDDITDTGARLYTNISTDNLWHLDLAGTGNKPGQLLGRIIGEARAYHRPQHPIPLCTIDFDYTNDSDGNPWASSDATTSEYTCQVGEPVLDVVTKLVETGVLTVQMGPDFDLHAYNTATYGRDLSGDAFGTGVVRFEKGVNIVGELRRTQEASTVATHLLVAGETGNYGDAALSDAASRVVQEAYLTAFGTGEAGLDGQGAVELAKRLRDAETISFQIANRRTALSLDDPVTVGSVVGGTAAEGYYLPGPPGSANGDFWVGDTVRVHTGSVTWDFNETDFQIRAISIARDDDNGELIVIPEDLLELPPPPPPASRALLLFASTQGGVGIPALVDLSANGWTRYYFSGDFTNGGNGQVPGPGDRQTVAIYARAIVPGESASVAAFVGAVGQHYALWCYELDGLASNWASAASTVGLTGAANPAINAYVTVGATAAVPSVLIGGFALQKVNYGQVTIISAPMAGTQIRQANGVNQDGSAGVCLVTADGYPPYTFIGYEAGTGALAFGGTIVCTGAGPDYNLMSWGKAALLLPTDGSFTIVQSAFDESTGGGSAIVTLPAPPGTL